MVMGSLTLAAGPWGGMLVGWLFAATLVVLLPAAFALNRVLRRVAHIFRGPVITEDKVTLITGASSGIGRHVALEYARRRAKLVLVARREGLLKEVAEECRAYGAKDVAIFPSNVAKEEDCKKMVNFAVETFGRLDILVNNAGTTNSKLFEESTDLSEFRYVLSVDFWGNVYPTLYALEHLQRTKGQIVVTSSVAAFIPYPYLSFYTAAKGAIVSFYDTLRVETLLRKNIGITIALPGFVDTEMTQNEPPGHIPKWWPMISGEVAGMAIVEGATQRRRYVVVPGWYSTSLFYRVFTPEILIWLPQIFILWGTKKPQARLVPISKSK